MVRWRQIVVLAPPERVDKSILFRDPDGNLVDLFTPVSPEAIERFSKEHGR